MPDLERLLNAIDAAEETAYGGDYDSDLSNERALALDYYYGRNVEPSPDGRSQVVDRSVFETVQWVLPSLSRIFANGDDVVAFTPFGPEDEEQAKQEGDYLNYVVTQRNPWFTIFTSWAQDALLSKNAYCLAYVENKIQTETETYLRQSDEAVAMLTQDEGVEIVSFESEPDNDSPPQPVMDPMTGGPMLDPMTGQPALQPRMLHNITIRRTTPQQKLRFRVLPPERCKVSEQTPSYSLEDCDYFEYYDDVTISSLRAQGFDVPDDIVSDDGAIPDTEVDDSRNLYSEREMESNPIDPSMRLVRARMIWIRYDYDEDGIAEMQKVLRVGRRIFDMEQATRIPVGCIVPNINTHRHIGTSLADMVVDIQRIKTAILRQGLDNLYQSNNVRYAVSDKVNLDDLSISAPGYNVRMEGGALPAEGHILPLMPPFMFPQAMQGLEYMDQVRENRTGTNRYFTGIDQNALNKTASGIQQLSTMAAQRVEQIARIISTGVEYLFSVAHELLIKSGHKGDVVKLRGRWVQIDPAGWKTGRDMRIVVGYGAGNKDALVSRLTMIANFQKEAMMGGLRIVTPQNIYETAIELTKAADFSAPSRFWTDPATVPPPPPTPSEAEIYAGVEHAKLQNEQQIKAAELAQQSQESELKATLEKYKVDLNAELQLLLEQLKLGGSVDLEQMRARSKAEPLRKEGEKLDALARSTDLAKSEISKLLSDFMGKVDSSVTELLSSASAPRELVRDKAGKVSGVKVNGKVRPVARDEQGRVTGLQ